MIKYVSTPDKGALNMRAEPNLKSIILKRIPYGENIEVEINGDWAKTSYQGLVGYVKTQYLSDKVDNRVTKEDLKRVKDSLQSTLDIIESILK